eukprot:384877-Pelagomonas_calceolata.AAC.1
MTCKVMCLFPLGYAFKMTLPFLVLRDKALKHYIGDLKPESLADRLLMEHSRVRRGWPTARESG